MDQKQSRFSTIKQTQQPHEESEMPTRLQSIMLPRRDFSQTLKQKFTPKIPTNRQPKQFPRRKSSELASEYPRVESLTEIQQSISHTLLATKSPRNRTASFDRFKKKRMPIGKVAFGAGPSIREDKDQIEQARAKEMDEFTWLVNEDAGNYPPITLPFFDTQVQQQKQQTKYDEAHHHIKLEEASKPSLPYEALLDEDFRLKDKGLLFVQLPQILPISNLKENNLSGTLGKMRIYKSGRMVLTIGDQNFEVLQGVKNSFYQEVAAVSDDSFYSLGAVNNSLIVAPEIL